MTSERRVASEGYLFTDFYQLTMGQLYFRHGLGTRRAHMGEAAGGDESAEIASQPPQSFRLEVLGRDLARRDSPPVPTTADRAGLDA